MRSTALSIALVLVSPACSRHAPDTPASDAVAVRLYCGAREVQARIGSEQAWLSVGTTTVELRRVRAASGAKYQAVDDSTTMLWNQGERTLVVFRGESFGECGEAKPDSSASIRAFGHEPEWQLTIEGQALSFVRGLGEPALLAKATTVVDSSGVHRYRASIQEQQLVVTILDSPCADSMTGMPHPQRALVSFGDQRWLGCGGTTGEFLQGGEWRVEDIGGGGIVDDSHVTLSFQADGRVFGSASCNNYSGSFSLTGENISFGPMISTRKACVPALMDQETRFLGILGEVRQLGLSATGALLLRTVDGRQLTARRD